MNSSIRIILVNTTHPGNIGAVARAMKNMDLSQLYLVNPRTFPHPDATARASGADDILLQAKIVNTLEEAVADCVCVMGTSARMRDIAWPLLEAREAAKQIANETERGMVAIVFGTEHSGLSNSELESCHYLINIPCNTEFSSLNIAAAVQIISYEIFLALRAQQTQASINNKEEDGLATQLELQNFYLHLREVLIDLAFLDPQNPRKLMHRLIRLFNRARLEKRELNILRGILTAVENLRN